MRWWLVALGVILASAWIRSCTESNAEYHRAVQFEKAPDTLPRALEHYQFAARWYTPFSGTSSDALDALIRIADGARVKGDRALALKALRRARGAILATRWLFNPYGERLERVNRALAEVTADEELARQSITSSGKSRANLVDEHLSLLAQDPAPDPWWSLLVVLSFFGWVSCAAFAIWRGFDSELEVDKKPLAMWVISAAISFALWLVSLSNA